MVQARTSVSKDEYDIVESDLSTQANSYVRLRSAYQGLRILVEENKRILRSHDIRPLGERLL